MIETEKLIQWFRINKRQLPWRETNNPYHVWLSEIILQQTRVNQGLPYYLKFIATYPTVENLASASKDQVFKLWQGLGYYRRAENMMKTAKVVAHEFNGVFPDNYSQLKQLPGIGDYTAAAIASIAYSEKVAVVDGNVYRVLARLFDIKTPIQTATAKKEFASLAISLMNHHKPGEFNEALMEFGALQCVPANPQCNQCIFADKCYAFKNNAIANLPVVQTKKKKRKLFLSYLVVEWQNQIILRYRTENNIWKWLYDFPSLENDELLPFNKLQKKIKELSWLKIDNKTSVTFTDKIYKHQLTHIAVSAQFIILKPYHKPTIKNNNLFSLVPKQKVANYPVHKLIEQFLKDHKLR